MSKMARIFNQILKKFNPILKTSELPLRLLLQAEVSPLHQLHVGHPGNTVLGFEEVVPHVMAEYFSVIPQSQGKIDNLLNFERTQKTDLSLCGHFV